MTQKHPSNDPVDSGTSATPTRRNFVGSALGAAAALGMVESTLAQAQAPGAPLSETNPRDTAGMPPPGAPPPASLFRLECDVTDCEIEGKLPADLHGIFYRVGPDAQYPMNPHNIPFDGEGHVSMFRFENGRVSFRSRYARNQRYKAQAAAHKILFPMYRNPSTDDPSVQNVSRGTANTHILYWREKLLAFKEDSPPVALNPLTLETVDDYYTFDGQLESKTFTAHPKIDAVTGNMIAFGYEGRGFGSDEVNVFEYTPEGKRVWNTWIKVPYVGMLHDFAVTQKHVVFYVMPLAIDHEQLKRGGIHWSWDGTKPTYFGFMRRGGDGKEIQWVQGPTRSSTHVMGAFDDGHKIVVDVEMSEFNPFPFMPFRDGTKWDPIRGSSRITRLSVDLSHKTPKDYQIETLYANYLGALPRIDDRYLTVPYRFGFLPCQEVGSPTFGGSNCYARFDHQTRTSQVYKAPPGTTLAEACFAPKSKGAPEASGYLMGVATRMKEGGRSDLLVFDAERLGDGPIATVRLPTRVVGQIHGWWVPGEQLPRV
jgi:carotenoid cleavage dioxygenase-like enzyme